MAMDHKNALPVGYRLNEYEVESLLGHGGFGITYKAQDTSLGSWVAIKEYLPQELALREGGDTVVPKSEADAGSYQWGLERFLDEARILAQFKHNNIVRVLRYLEANGTAYLVMDFEAGQSLGDYLAQVKQPLDEAAIRDIFLPIMDGLREVHTAGLLHRDIKPGNIYLRENGAPMLIDFGAARTALGERSKSLSVLVTPGYAPAEQYSSRAKQSPATDIYALGATMYRCLTGEVPIEASERQTTIFSDQEPDPLPSARSVGEGRYSDQLLASIDWALQIRAQDRPQTVRELQQAMQGSAAVEVNTGPPPMPSMEPVSRPLTEPVTVSPAAAGQSVHLSRRALFGGVAALLLIPVALLVGYAAWQEHRAEQRAEQQAELERVRAEKVQVESRQYQLAAEANSVEAYTAYLDECDLCEKKDDATLQLDKLSYAEAAEANSLEALEEYLASCDPCVHREDAVEKKKAIAEAEAQKAKRAERDAAAIKRVRSIYSVRRAVLETRGYMPAGCRKYLANKLRGVGITVVGRDADYDAVVAVSLTTPKHYSVNAPYWSSSGYSTDYSVTVKRRGDGRRLFSESDDESGDNQYEACTEAAEEIVEEIEDARD